MINKDMLRLLKQEIVSNKFLKEKMGDSIEDLITYKPTLNATELNSISGAKYFITLSCNQVVNQGSSLQIILKVGVAVAANVSEDEILEIFPIVEEVRKIVEDKQLIYDNPEQFDFSEMEEAYFDDKSTLWGYVMLFITKDAN